MPRLRRSGASRGGAAIARRCPPRRSGGRGWWGGVLWGGSVAAVRVWRGAVGARVWAGGDVGVRAGEDEGGGEADEEGLADHRRGVGPEGRRAAEAWRDFVGVEQAVEGQP